MDSANPLSKDLFIILPRKSTLGVSKKSCLSQVQGDALWLTFVGDVIYYAGGRNAHSFHAQVFSFKFNEMGDNLLKSLPDMKKPRSSAACSLAEIRGSSSLIVAGGIAFGASRV